MRQQLDDLRDYLGPAGKCQITSGEVTLLPAEDLGRIGAYALRIGLDPMVMTNGERFLAEGDFWQLWCVTTACRRSAFMSMRRNGVAQGGARTSAKTSFMFCAIGLPISSGRRGHRRGGGCTRL